MADFNTWLTLERKFREQGMSTRASNCLINLGCERLEDAAKFSRTELLECPNLGRTTINEIVEMLNQRGMSLKAEPVIPLEQRLARALGRVNATKAAYETARKALDEIMGEGIRYPASDVVAPPDDRCRLS
jgi:hypothetical protein